MIAHKKEFYGGVVALAGFIVVLILIFMPLYHGHNGLDYLDSLYNSISKGSAYYIPKIREEIQDYSGKEITVNLSLQDEQQAQQSALLFQKAGAMVNVSGSDLKVSGNLAQILGNSLDDSDAMYFNEGQKVSDKYGYDERRVLYNWWTALKEMDRDLKNQKLFKEAKAAASVQSKAVETAYNYYRIDPQRISDRWGIVIFSLVFYVVYTLWYGFAIMWMFEGWGMRLEH
jgi:hypothetical protein